MEQRVTRRVSQQIAVFHQPIQPVQCYGSSGLRLIIVIILLLGRAEAISSSPTLQAVHM